MHVASCREAVDDRPMALPIEMPDELADALGRPVAEEELRLWAALKPTERPTAVRRAVALTRWHDHRRDWTVDDAARAAGLAKNRFYVLAAGWEDETGRSLARLGVAAEAPRRRRSFDEALLEKLRAAAVAILSRSGADDLSISTMATELAQSIPANAKKKPGTAVLRAMLVEARRLHRMHGGIGTDLGFDLCACQLADEEGRPYVLFVCIDRGTGFVLAFGFGDPAQSLARHRALAAEVLANWEGGNQRRLPWTPQTERVEMVVGLDRVPFNAWAEAIRAELELGSKVNLQPSIAPRRFGRYIRKHFGTAVGRIRLLPASTRDPSKATSVSVLTKERYSLADAIARVGLEIADHNDAVLDRLGKPAPMPKQIADLLKKIAAE